MLEQKNNAPAATKVADDELEMVGGGTDISEAFSCPYCGEQFEFHNASESEKANDALVEHMHQHIAFM